MRTPTNQLTGCFSMKRTFGVSSEDPGVCGVCKQNNAKTEASIIFSQCSICVYLYKILYIAYYIYMSSPCVNIHIQILYQYLSYKKPFEAGTPQIHPSSPHHSRSGFWPWGHKGCHKTHSFKEGKCLAIHTYTSSFIKGGVINDRFAQSCVFLFLFEEIPLFNSIY